MTRHAGHASGDVEPESSMRQPCQLPPAIGYRPIPSSSSHTKDRVLVVVHLLHRTALSAPTERLPVYGVAVIPATVPSRFLTCTVTIANPFGLMTAILHPPHPRQTPMVRIRKRHVHRPVLDAAYGHCVEVRRAAEVDLDRMVEVMFAEPGVEQLAFMPSIAGARRFSRAMWSHAGLGEFVVADDDGEVVGF